MELCVLYKQQTSKIDVVSHSKLEQQINFEAELTYQNYSMVFKGRLKYCTVRYYTVL